MNTTPNGEREAAEVLATMRHHGNVRPNSIAARENAALDRAIAFLQSPAAVQQGEGAEPMRSCYEYEPRRAICVECMEGNPDNCLWIADARKAGTPIAGRYATPSPASPEVGGLVVTEAMVLAGARKIYGPGYDVLPRKAREHYATQAREIIAAALAAPGEVGEPVAWGAWSEGVPRRLLRYDGVPAVSYMPSSFYNVPLYTHPQPASESPPSDALDAMVNRFLCWPLPDTVRPDGTYPAGEYRQKWGHALTGTNLMTDPEARAMFKHCVYASSAESAEPLRAFARWVIGEHVFGGYDIDGGAVQDKAHALGLLVAHQVPEPCGESCNCASCGADFPTTCYRYGPLLAAAPPSDAVGALVDDWLRYAANYRARGDTGWAGGLEQAAHELAAALQSPASSAAKAGKGVGS